MMDKSDKINTIILVFILVIIMSLSVALDVHRWNTFKDETGSEIGYFKWKFVIDSNNHK